jgi:hypothetical protein
MDLKIRRLLFLFENIFSILFYFHFHLLLDGEGYVVPDGTVVTGIFDMRAGKHDLHFLVGVELLPHAFVNIPDEKMHIGVFFIFVFIIHFYSFMYIIWNLFMYFYL